MPVATEVPVVKPKRRRRLLRAILVFIVIMLLAVIISTAWVGWKFGQTTTKMFGGTPAGNMTALFIPTRLKGEDRGRVNILLVGNSVDDPGHPAADLTDSIMILSVNPQNNTADLLSIPRDLWVPIPGYGHQKINAVYPYGKAEIFSESGYPPGGIGLLQKVIEQNLKVTVDYYALINYSAVREAVNAVGGVDVNVQSPDPRGLYDPNIQESDGGPLRLSNGVQHLDGQTALNFTRARGDPTGDGRVGYGFPRSDHDRTDHQRQLFVALEDKISSINVMTNPFKIGNILDAVGGNVQTDLKINEARVLASKLRKINSSEIKSHSLAGDGKGVSLLRGYTAPNGQDALIPTAGRDNFSQISRYLQNLLTNSNP